MRPVINEIKKQDNKTNKKNAQKHKNPKNHWNFIKTVSKSYKYLLTLWWIKKINYSILEYLLDPLKEKLNSRTQKNIKCFQKPKFCSNFWHHFKRSHKKFHTLNYSLLRSLYYFTLTKITTLIGLLIDNEKPKKAREYLRKRQRINAIQNLWNQKTKWRPIIALATALRLSLKLKKNCPHVRDSCD